MLTSKNRIRSLTSAWPLLVALLLMGSPAIAQDDILVQTAEPDMAEQATYDLEVMVGGQDFPSDPEVEFFVTGTTDNGGITVKKVKRQGPKTLKVTIDVAEDAQFEQKFDIEVRKGGRKGKGTELFRVTEKEHPTQDLIPPGEPTDLRILEEGYGTVDIAWTMPADDGYDPSSGAVLYCSAGLVEGSRGCHPHTPVPPWPNPSEELVCTVERLDPDTEHLLGVRCTDEADNWSAEAQVVANTRAFSEFRDPSWAVAEVPYSLDHLAGQQFDASGNVVIGGVAYLWDQKRKGSSPVAAVVRIITGEQSPVGWSWSYEDVGGFRGSYEEASRIKIDPWGRAALVSRLRSAARKNPLQLVYTSWSGTDWANEVLTTDAGEYGSLGFEFGPGGQPSVAWCSGDGGVRLASRVAANQWDIEAVNQADCDFLFGGVGEIAFDVDGNPAISYSDRMGGDQFSVHQVRVARWTGSAWVEEPLEYPDNTGGWIAPPHLTHDPVRGDFTTAGDGMMLCDRFGANNWDCARLPFGYGVYNSGAFSGFDQVGDYFMAHTTYAEQDVVLARRTPGAGWAQEYVDQFQEHGIAARPHQEGAYLAFDSRNLPTLSWDWRLGSLNRPSEYHLYFAWKETP